MEEETAMAGTAIVFLNGPYSEKTGEGIDMLLAASAFDEEITAIFMGEGVKNLTEPREKCSSLPDLSGRFRMLELYDVRNLYASEKDLRLYGIDTSEFIVQAKAVSDDVLSSIIHSATNILTF